MVDKSKHLNCNLFSHVISQVNFEALLTIIYIYELLKKKIIGILTVRCKDQDKQIGYKNFNKTVNIPSCCISFKYAKKIQNEHIFTNKPLWSLLNRNLFESLNLNFVSVSNEHKDKKRREYLPILKF